MTAGDERAPQGDDTAETAPSNRAAVSGTARWVMIVLTLAGVALAIHQLFNLQAFGVVMVEGRYLYLLGGLFLAQTFLCFRARTGGDPQVPWYDWALAVLAIACACYFAWTAEISLDAGWEYAAPDTARYVSVVAYLLIPRRHAAGRRPDTVRHRAVLLGLSDLRRPHAQPVVRLLPAVLGHGALSHHFSGKLVRHSDEGLRQSGDRFHPVRCGAAAHRRRPVLQRSGARPRRAVPGRCGQGGDLRLGFHGLHVRFGHLQRADHRRGLNPGDEENWLFRALCRRDGGLRPRPAGS